MTRIKKNTHHAHPTIGQALLASAALVLAWLIAPQAAAQSGPQGLEALTPNQRATAIALNDLCQRLRTLAAGEGGPQTLTFEQLDLIGDGEDPGRCAGVFTDGGVSQSAIDEIGAQQFNAIRTVSVQFAQNQYQSVMDRLVALRAGERGTGLTDLKFRFGDESMSLAEVARGIKSLLGGGASSDSPDAGGLLDNRMGLWFRGNYGEGGKDRSLADAGFDSDQWGMTGGFDYRFRKDLVAGVSLGYGEADISFNPGSQGGFDTEAFAVSAYSTTYLGGIYFDGIVNYVDTDYDTRRRVFYTEAGSIIDRSAHGAVNGQTFSAGLAVGYDFVVGAFTFAPTLNYFYLNGDLDAFTERDAAGLNLAYDRRDFRSSTGNIGLRANYAWKTPIGVLIPQLRATFIREFKGDAETFAVRFASDPMSNTQPAPIVVSGGTVDQAYFRFAAGMSAQFKYDISGYFEYQRLESFRFVEFHDFTFGLRWQRSF